MKITQTITQGNETITITVEDCHTRAKEMMAIISAMTSEDIQRSTPISVSQLRKAE